MTINLGILAAGGIGTALLVFVPSRRPTLALAWWVASGVLLAEYMLFPGAATLHVHLVHLLLAGLLIGFGIGWAPASAPGKLELLILAFMGWVVVSGVISGTIFTEDGAESIRVVLSGFVVPVLILYLVRSTIQTPGAIRAACGVLIVLLGYLIVTAFAEHFQITWLVFPQYILDPSIGIHSEKARGPVVNGAENGGIIAILLLVSLHRARYALTPSVRWLVTLGLLVTSMPALWFTQERGPWVAFAGGLLIMLVHEPRRGIVSVLAAIAIAAIPVILWFHLELVPHRQDTIDFRIGLYRESLTLFMEHPIAGWGTGKFTSVKHLFNANRRWTSLGQNVQHDTIVAMATDTGAIGALLYISFLVVLFRSLLKARRAAQSPEGQDFVVTALAVLTTFVINGTFADARFWMPQNAVVFFLAGLALCPDRSRGTFPSLLLARTARANCVRNESIAAMNPPSVAYAVQEIPIVQEMTGATRRAWKEDEC
jgi:hypothetical protein